NAEIEKFRVGNFRSNLSYKEGQLAFSNLNAVVGKSNLSGNLVFDFEKSTLESEINSTDLHGEDLFFILKKRFEIPFDLTGTGQAHAKIHGPINFWKLNYNLTSELNQGSLAGERFEKLTANLDSDGEKINFTNVKLKKQKSNLTVEGRIATNGPEPQFDLKVKTNPLQLEESDYVIQYAPSIAGIGYTDGTVTGPIDSPTFISNVTLKQLTYDKVEYPNSQGQLKIDKKYLYFNGQFFGRQIQTDLLWPWNEQDNFSAKILIQELNPLFLLPLVSIPQPSSDFYSRLNAEVDLTSKHRSFSSADGLIKVSDFVLQRGNQSLHLTKPSRMIFKNGLSQMEDFNLTGEDSYLKVQMDKTMLSRVRFNIESDLQLRLLHFLVPFMQTLSGKLVLNSQVVFKDSGFELLGDGEITDGLVGLKGFPQTIENINAPIEFSKSKIILSDITGQMGPSDVTGLGTIDIIDSHNIEVSLKAVADNVQLNFPDKFFTQGKADVLFSGNWLPYNLKINYKVTQGLIENDFEPDPKQSLSLKASSFLPPQQVQALSPSLALDINVDLANGVLIKNKLLEGEAKGNIQVQGSPEQPIILGKINITPGSKIMFKDKPFDVQFGDVKFLGTKEINPELNIGANSHVSDYDITIQVQGLAKDFKITASSQPPLSQSDIITLLALGVTNQANQTLSSDTQQKQTGLEVLAAITNQSQLNKKIQDRLGLTLQLAPAVDSTKNIAVPKVVVTKKISKKVNASYSKPFTGNDQNQEVKLQYLYNNNVSFQVNYQNKEGTQTDQITNTTTTNKSIFGVDLEYRDEFK
ncbi:MAG: translocation/assembly module TamB domain-containing protein, partial [Pseudobdellovibrio sp.]